MSWSAIFRFVPLLCCYACQQNLRLASKCWGLGSNCRKHSYPLTPLITF